MSEFVGGEEKIINANDQIIFENKTDSIFEVCAGIIFHESGLYNVSISGNRVTVTKVANGANVVKRKHGTWTKVGDHAYRCSVCSEVSCCMGDYCPDCGAKMERSEDEK